ncbi:MAG: TPM domain-containing protein [Deltaproteobacteria bacterium]|nr:TPM domain-containing protein [Deltaproteobacteria bacterium]
MSANDPKHFFTPEQRETLIKAIREAERNSSGEIRIHVIRATSEDLFSKGQRLFEKLGMTKTRDRNGILFLLELSHRRFAILGDKGIHQKVPAEFWEEIRAALFEHFREGRFVEGLCAGIARCGEKLEAFYPWQSDDRNEVADEITSE